MKTIRSINTNIATSRLSALAAKSSALVAGALLLGGVCQPAVADPAAALAVNTVQVGGNTSVTAVGVGTGNNIVAADAAATTALNAQKAAINARYGNTVQWGPVVTTRVLKYDWLGRGYYQTTKTQTGSLGF